MVTYSKLAFANETIKTTSIKGKDYAEVNQRIKAFRMVYPTGFIITNILSLENGVITTQSKVGYYNENGEEVILATGLAQEKENSTFINKTSYIENAETSSCGRALGMAGFGIDISVASAEEVENAIANQENIGITKKEAEKYELPYGKYKGKTLKDVPKKYLEWLMNNNHDEYIKKCCETILGRKTLTDNENDKVCQLLIDIQKLEMKLNYNHESALKHYNVEKDTDMTIEQLEEYKSILESLKDRKMKENKKIKMIKKKEKVSEN